MLDLVNVSVQHRCKDLGHLRDLQTYSLCKPSVYREEAGAFRSTTRRDESRQPQPSTSQSVEENPQLTKLRRCISPVLSRDVQKHTSPLQVYRNTWMQANIFGV